MKKIIILLPLILLFGCSEPINNDLSLNDNLYSPDYYVIKKIGDYNQNPPANSANAKHIQNYVDKLIYPQIYDTYDTNYESRTHARFSYEHYNLFQNINDNSIIKDHVRAIANGYYCIIEVYASHIDHNNIVVYDWFTIHPTFAQGSFVNSYSYGVSPKYNPEVIGNSEYCADMVVTVFIE